MNQQIDPFKKSEHLSGAKMIKGNKHERQEIEAALREHVYGQKVTKIEFVRELDEEATILTRQPTDQIEVSVYLENNVCYIARIILPSFAVISRGDALAHVDEDNENYTKPAA